jgi:hypothetical protein
VLSSGEVQLTFSYLSPGYAQMMGYETVQEQLFERQWHMT